ncbi:sensor histidine kinase [Streptomyces ziwulingensis]|uniref:histidine kinase n=1 Tax=Streptomyces ziwulingensis TaxID=1045501 RepID=A0ABP9BTD9_9ACTN
MHAVGPIPVFPRRASRSQLVLLDALAAVGYLAVLGIGRVARTPAAVPEAVVLPPWGTLLLVAVTGLPLAVRRLAPVPVLAVVLTGTVTSVLLDQVRDPFVAVALALYTVAVTGPERRWTPWCAAGVLGLSALVGTELSSAPYWWLDGPGLVLFGWAAVGGAWAVGRGVRERRAAAALHAEHLARHAVDEERLHIARELHDVVAHSMGVIAVRAAVANHVAETRPQEAREALRVIEGTSRAALTEMRRMLGVLRADTDAPGPLLPPPGLTRLPELAQAARTAGVDVDLEVRDAGDLPEGVELSVYRIVQEALTNVIKHAGPARCTVRVTTDGRGTCRREVRMEVTDDGAGSPPPGGAPGRDGGHGLIGMRERAALYGGTLTAGPGPSGGYRVRACLPYQPVGARPGEGAS